MTTESWRSGPHSKRRCSSGSENEAICTPNSKPDQVQRARLAAARCDHSDRELSLERRTLPSRLVRWNLIWNTELRSTRRHKGRHTELAYQRRSVSATKGGFRLRADTRGGSQAKMGVSLLDFQRYAPISPEPYARRNRQSPSRRSPLLFLSISTLATNPGDVGVYILSLLARSF